MATEHVEAPSVSHGWVVALTAFGVTRVLVK